VKEGGDSPAKEERKEERRSVTGREGREGKTHQTEINTAPAPAPTPAPTIAPTVPIPHQPHQSHH
jgi:hypothetical protein